MNNNPISPHLQIYRWHISSLLSITHRIIGVINFLAIVMISIFIILTYFGKEYFIFFEIFLNSVYGKFFIISLCWTFSFQVLNEVRHLVWDFGYGFDLKTAKITGYLTLFGSLILTVIIYVFSKGF